MSEILEADDSVVVLIGQLQRFEPQHSLSDQQKEQFKQTKLQLWEKVNEILCRSDSGIPDDLTSVFFSLLKSRRTIRRPLKSREQVIQYFLSAAAKRSRRIQRENPTENLENFTGKSESESERVKAFLESLDHAFAQLSPLSKETLPLVLDGCSKAEIAEKLNVTERTAYSRVRRLVGELKEILGDED